MLIDSGAEVNTLCGSDWAQVKADFTQGRSKLRDLRWGDGKRKLTDYASATPLTVEATFTTAVSVAGAQKETEAKFHVIAGGNKSLLGRSTAIAMGVLKLASASTNAS